jgi:hypothetical protein
VGGLPDHKEVLALPSITIVCRDKLDAETKKIIKSFDYPEGTNKLDVTPFGKGGLSGASVYRVIPSGSSSSYIIKVGETEQINREYKNYVNFVKDKLGCAVKPKFNEGKIKSGLMETMLDQHNNYEGLSEAFDSCTTIEQVHTILEPIFACLCKWYSRDKKKEAHNIVPLFESVKKYQKQWKSNYGTPVLIPLQDLELSLFNPIDMSKVPSEDKRFLIAYTHGDLRFQNIFVNKNGKKPNLIDFAETGKGIILSDFARMEASVKFELLDYDLNEFFRLEKLLSNQENYDPIRLSDALITQNSKLSLVFQTVELIRQKAKKFGGVDDFKAYQYLLLLQSLKYMGYDWATQKERNRAHISAHLLTMVLNPTLAGYISPQIRISDEQRTNDFDPFYDTAIKLLKKKDGQLTVVQRTPSLLFKPQSKAERAFAKELKKCLTEKVNFNYIFSATESGAEYRRLDDQQKYNFLERLKKLKDLERKSAENEDHRFRIECLGENRKVFSPMILAGTESATFLAEDASDPRARRVVTMSMSAPSSTEINDLHDAIRKIVVRPDVQSYKYVSELIKKSERDQPQYEIIDKKHAMYSLGLEIAKESKKRLIIIQRTPSLVLGPEPLESNDGDKYGYDVKFTEGLWNIAENASKSELSFSYLWSKELTRDRIKSFNESKANDKIKKDLREKIEKNLTKLKNLEEKSSKTEHGRGYSFRIASISSSFLGPLALGDTTVAFLFADTGNKTLCLRVKSKAIADDIYRKIISEMPSIQNRDELTGEI